MASLCAIALLLAAAASAALAQDIVDNPFPKNGDVCRDAGDQWRPIKLGPCEKGTFCQGYKRGEHARRDLPPRGSTASARHADITAGGTRGAGRTPLLLAGVDHRTLGARLPRTPGAACGPGRRRARARRAKTPNV